MSRLLEPKPVPPVPDRAHGGAAPGRERPVWHRPGGGTVDALADPDSPAGRALRHSTARQARADAVLAAQQSLGNEYVRRALAPAEAPHAGAEPAPRHPPAPPPPPPAAMKAGVPV